MDISLNYYPKPEGGALGGIDFALESNDLQLGHDLETAVLVSLFTDRRANPDDPLPEQGASRRGWWGDSFSEISGDKIGSRLWLLEREKQTPQTLARAKEYVTEALSWLLTDGLALRYEVTVEWLRQGELGIGLKIERPKDTLNYRYQYLWQGLSFLPAGAGEPIAADVAIELETEAGGNLLCENSTGLST